MALSKSMTGLLRWLADELTSFNTLPAKAGSALTGFVNCSTLTFSNCVSFKISSAIPEGDGRFPEAFSSSNFGLMIKILLQH
jgi:hypothetical protein